MLSKEIRSRLAQLNRQAELQPVEYGVTRPTSSPTLARDDSLESVVLPGTEVSHPSGKHWLIQQSLDQLWRDGNEYIEHGQAELNRLPAQNDSACDDEVQAFRERFPQNTIFLDLETCGFAGSMIFLVGLMHVTDQGIVLSQLFARNYAEEKPMLHSLWQRMAECRVLVTFNGKSFDWPQVVDRCTLHRVATDTPETRVSSRPQLIHYDLLHHARRRWRHELPNCRLQTLERHICGRHRTGDIPGADIPRAYHDFVRTDDTRAIQSILHHNAMDLVTLLQLSMQIAISPDAAPAAGKPKRNKETKKGCHPTP